MKFFLAAVFVALFCAVIAYDDVEDVVADESQLDSSLSEKLKCVRKAVHDSLEGSHLKDVWSKAERNIKVISKELARCLKESELAEKPKCIITYSKSIAAVLKQFLGELKSENGDLYQKVKENIKKCF